MATNTKKVTTVEEKDTVAVEATPVKKTASATRKKAAEPAPAVDYKDIDTSMNVTVVNGTSGRLIYISPRTKEKFVWDDLGDEQEMELRELKSAKSSSKRFFEENWFMFDDEFKWVPDYLGVGKYYNGTISISEFDDALTGTPAEIKKVISRMPEGQKSALAERARHLISTGEIDSYKSISVIEDCLNMKLIDR